ncbi:MAG: TraB/GumN family protein, partial [Lacibacter sp.]
MKFKPFAVFIFLIVCSATFGQVNKKPSKYPSLFWEITRKGSNKPSYLFGTMHVSSKLVYNLPDSFYMGIKNVQVVALENDMAYWQQDMDKYDLDPMSFITKRNRGGDNLSINTFKVHKYEELIKYALASNPSVINNLLYRTYGGKTSDFEEDTFLDMFIYQCGKKYGKRTAGLENFDESMQLMIEAVKDAAKDKNKKQRSYDNYNSDYSPEKLEEAYRTGNLDLLDRIHRYNSESELFDEKFLYRRNEIQANSIDSIIKAGASVFAGVGAAHLPGTRGVIELLRSKGYIVRPVKMVGRSNQEKDAVDKITVPVAMQKITAEDGTYQLQAPGTFFSTNHPFFNQVQHADVSNGSYYMVTKITTNAFMWGQKDTRVLEIIDSLLYESIPGKILSKEVISKNGYQGYDIVNRTRRGDVQRYNIFVTAYEVLIFKMSGIGNYVSNSTEG